jgi:beta-galactosidase
VVVEFDGVYMNSEVWLNGYFLGRRPYDFIGFRYDLTEYLNANGAPNVLAVGVDDSLEPSLRWHAGSGIYRHVRLIETGCTHFKLEGGVTVTTPEVSAKRAIVQAAYEINAIFFTDAERQAWQTYVRNPKPVKRDLVLRRRVEDLEGNAVASTNDTLTLEHMYSRLARDPAAQTDPTPALVGCEAGAVSVAQHAATGRRTAR